jgi:tetratricopeptide (TPR) repeat protein
MTQEATTFTPENEKTYEALISLIENSQGRLAPIVVGCDDENLRIRVIDRYEAEAAKIPAYRITLGTEPSISRALAQLKASETYLQGNGAAVFTVTGAEYLLWIKTHEEDAQSELDKFFGYLQWTREALREYPYPIVIWVPHRILRQMSQRAPDFWSWRKAVLRFVDEEAVPAVEVDWDRSAQVKIDSEDTFLPPLEELLEEIQQLERRSADSASLGTLYDKLGQVYAWRVTHGRAEDLAQEQKAAINAFEQAIANQTSRQNNIALLNTLHHLGNFLHNQSRFTEAVITHQKSLDLSQKLCDTRGEAISLDNLGIDYYSLGQYQRAIALHQQSLELARTIGDKKSEANSLGNLGNTYSAINKYQEAIEVYQKSLEIQREIGAKQGEANSLGNLGMAYRNLEQYQRAIEFYQQSLEIQRETSAKVGEAKILGNLGNIYYSLGQYKRSIDCHQQSIELKREIGDKLGEATTLFNQASPLESLNHNAEAVQCLERAKSIFAGIRVEHMVKLCDEELAKLQP